MKAKLIIFSKIMTSENNANILFCITKKGFPTFNLAKYSVRDFARDNILTRHEKFDWYVNKTKEKFFLLEAKVKSPELLLTEMDNYEEKFLGQWLPFPQAIKKLTDGKERNFLQLSVQYISTDGIDESVIAADYDKEFLNTIGNKIIKKNPEL